IPDTARLHQDDRGIAIARATAAARNRPRVMNTRRVSRKNLAASGIMKTEPPNPEPGGAGDSDRNRSPWTSDSGEADDMHASVERARQRGFCPAAWRSP